VHVLEVSTTSMHTRSQTVVPLATVSTNPLKVISEERVALA